METTFILLEPDSFDEVLNEVVSPASNNSQSSEATVRRPLRGTQLVEDTWASIQVVTANKDRLPLYDQGAKRKSDGRGISYSYSNFVLQSVQDSRQEKFQSVETFGQDYGFFYGERPRTVRFAGKLMDTVDFNWHSEWWHNYEENLRGTKLVQNGARVYLTYETRVFEGYLLDATTSKHSMTPREADISFTMWVTGYRDLSNIGSTDFPGGNVDPISPADIQKYMSYGGAAVPKGLEVRQLNIAASSENNATSLLDVINSAVNVLQGGASSALRNTLGLDYIKNILLGKQVRVPVGFAGSDLLTAQNTLASGTIPDGFNSVSGVSQSIRAAKTATFPGLMPVKNIPTRGGIYDYNFDEYLQGGKSEAPSWEEDWRKASLYASSYIKQKEISDKEKKRVLDQTARAAFAAKGLNPDNVVSQEVIFFTRLAYGAASFGVSLGLEKRRKTEAAYLQSEDIDKNTYATTVSGDYDPNLDDINYGEGGDAIFASSDTTGVNYVD